MMKRTTAIAAVLAVCHLAAFIFSAAADESGPPHERQPKEAFLRLCDANAKALENQNVDRSVHSWGCFNAYVVRALAAAYDLERKEEYLSACKRWSDQTLEFQKGMIPKGAYYMHYGRAPGEDKGKWYVADSASIAMGVLATAVRCDDPAEKSRYLDSVKAFFRLVADNWVRPSGGVANGHWPKSDKEFWCATGAFGSLAFCLYNETGEPEYLRTGLGTIDWLNRQDLPTVANDHYPANEIVPTVMMYCLEAYSAGLPHVGADAERRNAAAVQMAKARKWILANMDGRKDADYLTQWGSKRGGLPFHLYVQSAIMPDGDELTAAADKEIFRLIRIFENAPPTSNLAAFALMSLAEKCAPGGIYRTSNGK